MPTSRSVSRSTGTPPMIIMLTFPFCPGFDVTEILGNIQVIDIDDPNFDPTISMVQEESPYAEVRSAVANTDDLTMPVSTLRAWVVGLLWAVLIPGINQFFSFRDPNLFAFTVCLS
jgi:hypothetical protein